MNSVRHKNRIQGISCDVCIQIIFAIRSDE